MDILTVFLLATFTALATGLGALPVSWIGPERVRRYEPFLLGVTAGVMTAASIGLLIDPIRENKVVPMLVGMVLGAAFLFLAQNRLEQRKASEDPEVGRHITRSILVFAVLFVHSLPEGFALGSAWASTTAGIGVFVFIAISLQNVPEGTATAIPMAQAGYSKTRQFWAAVGTSAPQPVGAVLAFVLVEEINALLPWSLGFAAGAMFALVAADLLPEAFGEGRGRMASGGLVSALVAMGLLALLLAAVA
ncbi:MAG: ZIP family metal transporter [Acidobacteria bacterium]|nr:ZIP family metal transporter [Acidobacteriota bacterium]